jgi:hypothetical protein
MVFMMVDPLLFIQLALLGGTAQTASTPSIAFLFRQSNKNARSLGAGRGPIACLEAALSAKRGALAWLM